MAQGNILCDAVPIYDASPYCTSVGSRVAGECTEDVSDTTFLDSGIFFSALCAVSDGAKKYGNRRRLKC